METAKRRSRASELTAFNATSSHIKSARKVPMVGPAWFVLWQRGASTRIFLAARP